MSNFNLGLCPECLENTKIQWDETVDEVTHKVTCPKCRRIYDLDIVDSKCKTKACNVWFFWDSLDCMVISRWIEDKNITKLKNEPTRY